jgi:hypothetical protein
MPQGGLHCHEGASRVAEAHGWRIHNRGCRPEAHTDQGHDQMGQERVSLGDHSRGGEGGEEGAETPPGDISGAEEPPEGGGDDAPVLPRVETAGVRDGPRGPETLQLDTGQGQEK